MSAVVVDASVIADFLLNRRMGPQTWSTLVDAAGDLHAPHVLVPEVASAIRGWAISGQIDNRTGTTAIRRLADLPVQLYDHRPLIERGWTLRHNLTSYDATYIALAELLRAPLLTADLRLAAAAERIGTVQVARTD